MGLLLLYTKSWKREEKKTACSIRSILVFFLQRAQIKWKINVAKANKIYVWVCTDVRCQRALLVPMLPLFACFFFFFPCRSTSGLNDNSRWIYFSCLLFFLCIILPLANCHNGNHMIWFGDWRVSSSFSWQLYINKGCAVLCERMKWAYILTYGTIVIHTQHTLTYSHILYEQKLKQQQLCRWIGCHLTTRNVNSFHTNKWDCART